jgi:hypothetical protein
MRFNFLCDIFCFAVQNHLQCEIILAIKTAIIPIFLEALEKNSMYVCIYIPTKKKIFKINKIREFQSYMGFIALY